MLAAQTDNNMSLIEFELVSLDRDLAA